MTADEVIRGVLEALDRSGGMDVIYIHPDPEGRAVAAIVRMPSQVFSQIDAYAEKLAVDNRMLPHDHIEPGMF